MSKSSSFDTDREHDSSTYEGEPDVAFGPFLRYVSDQEEVPQRGSCDSNS